MVHSPVAKTVLIIVTLLSVAVFFGIRSAVYVPPEVDDNKPAEDARTTAHAIATMSRLQEQLATLRSSAGRRHRPFTIEVSEDDLNAYLQTNPEAGRDRLPIREPHVHFGDNVLAVSGFANAGGREWYVDVSGTVEVSNDNRIVFRPVAVTVGKLNLPGPLRDSLLNAIRRRASGGFLDLPAEVEKVELRPGFLTVIGRPR